MKVTKTTYFSIQRKIVANMTSESWKNIPHTTYIYEPEVSKFMSFLNEYNKSSDVKITLNTAMLKVIAEGVKNAPCLNSHIFYNHRFVKGKIVQYENVDISMPWLMSNGEMMTINLSNIDGRSLKEIALYIENTAKKIENTDMTEAMFSVSMNDTIEKLKKFKIPTVVYRLIGAKFGKSKVKTMHGKSKKEYNRIPESERITKHDIKQGTITVSNIGSLYRNQRGSLALLEVIPPQVFAVGIGAVQKKAVVNSYDEIVVGQILPMCLAIDHRALDFNELVPLIKKLDDIFEHPEIILN